MNNDLSTSERAQKEYEHAVSDLGRYESDSQKLVSLITLVVTMAFAIGVARNIALIFPLVPFASLTVIQYLLANNYAYRVREQYVHRLELRLAGTHDLPALYRGQIKRYYLELKWWEWPLLPFAGSIGYTVILLVLVSVYSTVRAYHYLFNKQSWWLAFAIIGAGLLVHTIAVLIWSWLKLRRGERNPVI